MSKLYLSCTMNFWDKMGLRLYGNMEKYHEFLYNALREKHNKEECKKCLFFKGVTIK